jgi:hypothetical protein
MADSAWTIGVYSGASPFLLTSPADVRNPVVTAEDVSDLDVNIVAHPFLAVTDAAYYLFFTAKSNRDGEYSGIGCAQSQDGLAWRYRRIVLREPFVLSYPQVIAWQGEHYMVPEAYEGTSVRLYRASAFPDRWVYQRDLLVGDHFISPSLVWHAGLWWMFVSRLDNATLRLFHAPDLNGPWTEHPRSPLVAGNLRTARPASRPFVVDGVLYRSGQDCYPTYGRQVFAFRVTDISPTSYTEEMIPTPLVGATAQGWNAEGMHHVDAHQIAPGTWIAAVDAKGRA